LEDLRRQLRMRAFASNYTRANVRSQGPYTRMRKLYDQIQAKIVNARDRYRAARSALLALRGTGEWERVLRVLDKNDIHGIDERIVSDEVTPSQHPPVIDEDEAEDLVNTTSAQQLATGEGHRTLSWIWYGINAHEMEGDMHHSLRVEWVKARARALRWKEELVLLDEEMRRTLVFGEWMAEEWSRRSSVRSTVDSILAEGLAAYAAEHADIERARCARWASRWSPVRQRAREALSKMNFGNNLDDPITFDELEVELSLLPDASEVDEDHLNDDDEA
jgi:hypothetical protein